MDYKKEIIETIDREMHNLQGYAKAWIEKIKNKKYVCIFGAGNHSCNWVNYLKTIKVKVDFICDNDKSKWNKLFYEDIVCISPKQLEELKDEVCVVIAVRNYHSIKAQLEKMNITDVYIATVNQFCFKTSYDYSGNTEKLVNMKKNISKLLDICADEKSKKICSEVVHKWFDEENKSITCDENQYFTKEIVKLSDKEVFVDIGAFDGDTLDLFLTHCKQKFRAIHAFELNQQIYLKLCEKVKHMSESIRELIHLYPMGIWNEEQTITYDNNSTSSVISATGECKEIVKPLDNVLLNEKITFIKMDIEGAELNALYGSKEIIKKYVPKLAVCVYHKTEHLWEIPFFIKSLNPNYKIYLRHHSLDEHETVCYAIME